MMLSIKHRPIKFIDVVGNRVVKKSLSSSKVKDRIPRSLLISGKHGIGKTTLARIYAMLVNCSNVDTSGEFCEPCGECDFCKSIISGSAIDYLEINAADQRNIDDMRSLIEKIQMGLVDLKYRIIIIDEAQQLTKNSQNVLLKPLEEKNSKTIFMFCTTNPEQIINTLVSRGHRYFLSSPSKQEFYNHLSKICQLEDVKYDDESLRLIVDSSDGALRDALVILDQCMCASSEINKNVVSSFTNTLGLNFIYFLLENIVKCDLNEIYNIIEAIDSKNISPDKFLDTFITYLNDVLVYKETLNESMLQYRDQDYLLKIRSHSEILGNEEIIRSLMKVFLGAYRDLPSYPKKKHLLNLAFSECCNVLKMTHK